MARLPFWLKAVLMVIPAVILIVFLVLIAVGWYVRGQMLDSGGPLRPLMAAYDVRHVDLAVTVEPDRKRIDGSCVTTVESTSEIPVFEIHLDDRLEVAAVEVDGRPARFDHDKGVITVELTEPWRSDELHRVAIAYGGQPKVALRAPWLDGFVWSRTTSGEPWIGVTCEGDGADIWWPCKDHPSDEPDDGMAIALTVPRGMIGLANGRPLGEVVNDDGTVTSSWRVGEPINNYDVSIDIAPYVPVEIGYHGVDGGLDETVVFWALPEAEDDAQRLIAELPRMLEVFGRRFGEYPFFADKLWIAHAPYLGMEHQTLVAYGAGFVDNDFGFDELLAHELAHEWWGNKVTARDWGDFWLHEGFASYAEALIVLDTLGEDRYLEYMQVLRQRMTNRAPVIKGSDLTTVEAYSPDLYGKGAWVLHMLRLLLGDERFDKLLWRFADGDHPAACRFVSTRDFTELAEEVGGRPLDWFWRRYLYTAELPAWRVHRSAGASSDRIAIQWNDTGFEMPLPVQVGGDRRLVEMHGGRAELVVGPGIEVVVDPDHEVLANAR